MKAVLIVLALAACGREPAINKDLQASVDRYLRHAPNHGHIGELVSVDWGEVGSEKFGTCIRQPNATKTAYVRKVRISPQISGILLDATVAHELAHCLHDKPHDESRQPALMNAGLTEYLDWWDAHLDNEIERLF